MAARSIPIPITPSGAVAAIRPTVTSSMIRLRRLMNATFALAIAYKPKA